MLTPYRLAIVLLVALTPFAIGGTRADVQLVCGLLVALTTLVALLGDRLRDIAPSWVTWAWFIPAFWACIQLVPLPIELLATLSPTAADLYQSAQPNVAWAPLSVDLAKTATAAIHQLSFAAIFVLTVMSGHSTAKSLRWVIIGAVTSSAALAAGHWAFDADQILGLYEASHRAALSGYFGPFVNENTFASFLVLGCLLACGVALAGEDESTTRIAIICALVCAFATLATGSRGGVLALVLGWVTLGFIGLAGRKVERPGLTVRFNRMFAIGSILLLVGVACALGYPRYRL